MSWRSTWRRTWSIALVAALVALVGVAVAPPTGAGPTAPAVEVISLYNYGLERSPGSGLVSELVADDEGVLYGTTSAGGEQGYGTVFSLAPPGPGDTDWTHTVLHSFCQQSSCFDGSNPLAGLVFAQQPSGATALFGTTNSGGNSGYGTTFRLLPPAAEGAPWTHRVLTSFDGGSDGAYPEGRLVAGAGGVLYGTTTEGGVGDCVEGCGTAFALVPPGGDHPDHWEETVLHSFGIGDDGTYPYAGLTLDTEGRLYGTTYEGGTQGYGTVFQLTPSPTADAGWTQVVLHDFVGDDGANPLAGLLLDPTGEGLYGTTAYGGAACDAVGDTCGTVFKLVPPDPLIPTWTVATLHSFDPAGQDALHPLGDLVFGPDGAIYGTSEYGGTPVGDADGPCDLLESCGTIFRLTGAKAAWDLSVVHRFCRADIGCPVGAQPTAGLTMVGGELFGTTSYDGEGYACGCGTIFTMRERSDDELPPTPPTTSVPEQPASVPVATPAGVAVTASPRFAG